MKKNIYCIEGDWNDNLKNELSVRNGLELLKNNLRIDYIYKQASTKEEFFNRINQLYKYDKSSYKKYENFKILYFAFHGYKNGFSLSNNSEISLDEISDKYKNQFHGKIVHFGSCSTLKVGENKLLNFLELTGASAISGFGKNVDFFDSSIFELLYFSICQRYTNLPYIERNILKSYSSMVQDLKFRIFFR